MRSLIWYLVRRAWNYLTNEEMNNETLIIIIVVAVIFIAITAYSIYSNRNAANIGEALAKPINPEKKDNAQKEANEEKTQTSNYDWRVMEAKRRAAMTPEQRKEDALREKAHEIFCDHRIMLADFTNLSPEQAKTQLRILKEDPIPLDDAFYIPLKRISEGKYPLKEFPPGLDLKNAAEVFQWWLIMRDENTWIDDDLFNRISDIIKPYHEETLLEELKSITPAKVEAWAKRKKKEGFFFSYAVYDKCEELWMKQFRDSEKTEM